ncbi:MAG: ZIP family metal transporter [Clostridia bacterium]|nr:ZIP family metal transporter [Clostridia bacterium]
MSLTYINSPIIPAFLATLFTYFVTALGAASVFLFSDINRKVLDFMMSFAGGVMIAASFWSLLSPATELLLELGRSPFIMTSVGFTGGGLFIIFSDVILKKVSAVSSASLHRSALLVSAVTLHNIPEGLAVGVAFGCASLGISEATVASAISLAVGIGLQNFPEGACVALPLRRDGMSSKKCFFIGQASGMVEPIAGILGAIAAITVREVLPFALSFSAGAMIAVVCSELIPESFKDSKIIATLGIILGFVTMMILDVALG